MGSIVTIFAKILDGVISNKPKTKKPKLRKIHDLKIQKKITNNKRTLRQTDRQTEVRTKVPKGEGWFSVWTDLTAVSGLTAATKRTGRRGIVDRIVKSAVVQTA